MMYQAPGDCGERSDESKSQVHDLGSAVGEGRRLKSTLQAEARATKPRIDSLGE
jgi:hypothetical protein